MDWAVLMELARAGATCLYPPRGTGSDRLLLLSGDAIRRDIFAGVELQGSAVSSFLHEHGHG